MTATAKGDRRPHRRGCWTGWRSSPPCCSRFAAVATAWSSYQANRWNGEQAKASGRVNALRIEAARAQGLAEAQTQVDIAMFFQWVNATATDEQSWPTSTKHRFRPEFRPAFDAWLATDPLTNADAPPTPFAMDEYELPQEDTEAAGGRRRSGGRQGSAQHPTIRQLRPRCRPLRRRPVLRRDEHKAARRRRPQGDPRRRMRRVHRDCNLDRHVPRQHLRLTGGCGEGDCRRFARVTSFRSLALEGLEELTRSNEGVATASYSSAHL